VAVVEGSPCMALDLIRCSVFRISAKRFALRCLEANYHPLVSSLTQDRA
jgi:hypothetical protein